MLTRARKMVYRARGYVSGALNGEPFRFDPYHSKFWRKASAGGWEPETFAMLDRYLDKDHDYLDIGAWIGPTVLYGARKARHVWCFEPDPEAFRALAWNIDLNGLNNVSAFAAALSQGVGVARMAGFHGEKGDSTTSLLNPAGAAGSDVLTLGFDQFETAVDLNGVSLVKMDVEGAEFDLLPTLTPWLAKRRPALLLSIHAPFLAPADRRRRVEELIDALGFYPRWQDEARLDIAPQSLLDDDALNRFRSVLLCG
ncbi:FkbM family methyltransferase [Sedimentitalea sp. JM2-8]|uniref:FkbM family methyltransferase n=1 Tax=Sedimentitalea xiamensis TaxID=3050037 RepID=A0ABT7FCH2_9RHOB|nr:FkbM family methyltransferase [Sedimentitalea xiamensis]MDK3072816.1 FkbM family methyltransferase [Sedimentitalea xiamensis]